MEPKLVESTPPRFRVRRIVHGAEADLEAVLNAADEDGYEARELVPSANGDLLLVLEHQAEPAAEAEEA